MSVKISFNLEDEDFGCEHSICMDNHKEFNSNQVVSGDITFAYEYTGRHDTGVLPQLKSSGPFAALINDLKEAKVASDEFLSQKINLKYGYTGAAPNSKGGSDRAVKGVAEIEGCPQPPTSSSSLSLEQAEQDEVLENETKRPKLDDFEDAIPANDS